VGLFADGLNGVAGPVRGLFYGSFSQFAAQLVGILTNIIFVFAVMYAFFKVLNWITPLRVSPELENEGLDQAEVVVVSYPDFNIRAMER
jgi:Amt family ammonium transporter